MVDNPRAFPSQSPGHISNGMTLLDYFAAKIIAGLLANDDFLDRISIQADKLKISHEEALSRAAYIQAKAMLAERALPKETQHG
jgi:hypothetical protein